MTRTDERLRDRADRLAGAGADPARVELLEKARRFKRSWLEMAEALVELRASRAYEAWGYPDLHAYCEEELLIRRATVEKLTLSFTTIERHAPEVFERDGVERPLPSFDTVDYFAQVMGEREGAEPPRERPPAALDDLRRAVFDDGVPLGAIRKQFNPVFYSRTEEEEELDRIERTTASVRRLAALLTTVAGLPRAHVKKAEEVLADLQADLESLLGRARDRVQRIRDQVPAGDWAAEPGHSRRVKRPARRNPRAAARPTRRRPS